MENNKIKELQNKLRMCKTVNERISVIKNFGAELSSSDLDNISGGVIKTTLIYMEGSCMNELKSFHAFVVS